MHEFLVSVVAFVVLIGIMVVVHEFGHFAVAKLCGVRVEAFSLGFGPRLFGVKRGDTDYKVCLLPFGGYVKMSGENFSELSDAAAGTANQAQANDPGAFTSHPRWQRMLIGVAGPFANFILAFVLMFIYFNGINEVPAVEVKETVLEWVTPDSAAGQAGLETGDKILRFDTVSNPSWEKVYERLKLNANRAVPVTVERGGQTLQLSLHVPSKVKADDFDLSDAGMLPQYLYGPIVVKQVQAGTPAERAGLRNGDAIQSVDGHPFHAIPSLLVYMQSGQGKPLSLQVMRGGKTFTIVAHPAKIDTGWKLGFAPVQIPFRREPLPVFKAFSKSSVFCSDNSFLIFEVLGGLFTNKVSVSQLAGPVGIARMAGEAAEMRDWSPKFGLAAEISLNLGILNLLPFPILDGGMILLLLIESAMRHDISINVKERIYQAAFVMLMMFFAFVIFNDVTKLPIFMRLRQ
jgi:regulator of sigma E protease